MIKNGDRAIITSIGDKITTMDINRHLGMIVRNELAEFDHPKGEKLSHIHIAEIKEAFGQMLHDRISKFVGA